MSIILDFINLTALVCYAMLFNFFLKTSSVTDKGMARMRALCFFFASYFFLYAAVFLFEVVLNIDVIEGFYGAFRPYVFRGVTTTAALWLVLQLYRSERT